MAVIGSETVVRCAPERATAFGLAVRRRERPILGRAKATEVYRLGKPAPAISLGSNGILRRVPRPNGMAGLIAWLCAEGLRRFWV